MISIPDKGTPERDAMIEEHRRCVDSMKGVAGFSVVQCATQGDTTDISGGWIDHPDLRRVLLRMRGESVAGKLIIVCTKIEKEWRIARLSGIRGVPPVFVNDKVYDDEQEIQHDIFLMRLDELPKDAGMPEHYHEGWKRKDDNWPVT